MANHDYMGMPQFPGFGTGESSYRAKYGYAPYEESAVKSGVRNWLMQGGLSNAFGGLGAVPGGANFGTAFLAAAGRSGVLQGHASEAARAYAQKQVEARQAREHQIIQEKYLEALTTKAGQPEKTVETHAKPPWYLRPEWKGTPEGKAAADKANHIATKTPKPPAKSKPDKPPPVFIQKNVRLINAMDPNDKDDIELLNQIMKNPPTPEEGEAAKKKLGIRGGFLGNLEVYPH